MTQQPRRQDSASDQMASVMRLSLDVATRVMPRLVFLTICRRSAPHRPHHWGWRRFCRGGWDSRWTERP